MKNKKEIIEEKDQLWLLIDSRPLKTFSFQGIYDYASAISKNNQYIAVQILNQESERQLLIFNTLLKRKIKLQQSNFRQLIFSPDSNILVGFTFNKQIQVLRLKSTSKKFKVEKQYQLNNPKNFNSFYKMQFKTEKNQLFLFSIENGQYLIWNLENNRLIVVVNYYLQISLILLKYIQEDSNLLGIIKKMRAQYQTLNNDYQKLIFKTSELISAEYLKDEGGMFIKCRNKILRKHFNQFEQVAKSIQITPQGLRILCVTQLFIYLYSVSTGEVILKKKNQNIQQLILTDDSLIIIEGEIIKFWDFGQL